METVVHVRDEALSARERVFALIEVMIGAAVVVGHNVYRVVPNEVPILVILLWASLLIRRRPWASVGLGKPTTLKNGRAANSAQDYISLVVRTSDAGH